MQHLEEELFLDILKIKIMKAEGDLRESLSGEGAGLILCPFCKYIGKNKRPTAKIFIENKRKTLKCFACGEWRLL